MEVKDRIIELRKKLKLTQIDFAKELGVTSSAISSIEKAKNMVTEANIKLICYIFNVNERWLRTGEGNIFSESAPGEKDIIDIYRTLSVDGQKMLLEYSRLILKNEQTFSGKVPEPPQAAEKQEASPEPEPEPPQVAEILPGPEPDPDLTGKNRA
jgi:transcriptional regulator with XRE-family HTH domain